MKIWITLFYMFSNIAVLLAAPNELFIDNGTLTVKVDLTRGGTINWVSVSGSDRNLVNTHDEGRYIQQSYYAGKSLDRTAEGQSPDWSPWSWNPIQAGDAFKNRAEILDYRKSSDTLYVKCIPMLWDMNNKPAEAELEQWTVLMGNTLQIHNKLTCFRTDTLYGEGISNNQELPAVYPVSALSQLYSYTGDQPFTGEPLENLEVIFLSSGFWGRYESVPEHWMAFVDENQWGMGVYNPKCTRFLAGMYKEPGGETDDASTSYIAPVKKAALNKDTVYEYSYYIIIGSLEGIREKVYELEAK